MGKRGRKPSGVVTKPIFRRVPDDLVERVDAFLDKAIKERHAGNLAAIDSWLKETYGVSPPLPEPQMVCNAKESVFNEAMDKVIRERGDLMKRLDSLEEARSGAVHLPKGKYNEDQVKALLDLGAERDGFKNQVKALLDNVEELTKQKAYWEERFNKAVAASESQMINYWRGLATKAEQRVAELESNG